MVNFHCVDLVTGKATEGMCLVGQEASHRVSDPQDSCLTLHPLSPLELEGMHLLSVPIHGPETATTQNPKQNKPAAMEWYMGIAAQKPPTVGAFFIAKREMMMV